MYNNLSSVLISWYRPIVCCALPSPPSLRVRVSPPQRKHVIYISIKPSTKGLELE